MDNHQLVLAKWRWETADPTPLRAPSDQGRALHNLQLQQQVFFSPERTTAIDQHKKYATHGPPQQDVNLPNNTVPAVNNPKINQKSSYSDVLAVLYGTNPQPHGVTESGIKDLTAGVR